MNKSAFYNPDKAKEESELKKVQNIEADKREIYFEQRKKDKLFQKYVVDELIRANISSLNDNSKILDTKRTKEELADLIIANVKASQTLTNILCELL